MGLNTLDVLDVLVELARSKGAEDIVIMDLRDVTDTTDYFVICTGNSDVHIRTLTDSLIEGIKKAGERPWYVEGYSNLRWVLIDFVNVVVHIFGRQARQFYALERLWGDAQIERVDDGEKVMDREKTAFC